ncbi:MAG TPA: hypothetical protein VIC28_02435 [Thermoanaerobaculia bacterium]|jgi:hypothetical protein
MPSKDQPQESSSSSDDADAIARDSIDVGSDGGGTVNDPPPSDHRPPSA